MAGVMAGVGTSPADPLLFFYFTVIFLCIELEVVKNLVIPGETPVHKRVLCILLCNSITSNWQCF